MKIIRLTSENSEGMFDSYFNEDIYLEENSKVALMNTSLESITTDLIVNDDNNEITFNLRSTNPLNAKTIYLDFTGTGVNQQTSYNSNNYSILLKEIQDKMNQSLLSVGAEIGVQFKLQKGTTGKLEILGTQSDISDRRVSLKANVYKVAGVDQLVSTNSTPVKWNRPAGVLGTFTNEALTYYQHA